MRSMMLSRRGAVAVLVAALFAEQAFGLSVPSVMVTRRRLLEVATAAATAAVVAPQLAWAASGDNGGLPDGALQFDRYIKVQAEWDRLGPRLKSIDDIEWDGVRLFLRKLYDEGSDMTYLVRNLGPDKKAQAKDLAKDFQAKVKEADKLANAKDKAGLAEFYKPTAALMKSALELLQDIPDEL